MTLDTIIKNGNEQFLKINREAIADALARKKRDAERFDEMIMEKNRIKNERDLQAQIGNFLTLRDIVFSRNRMDRKSTATTGTPDFLICYRGLFLGVEVKMPGGKLRPEQREFGNAIERNKGIFRVIESLAALQEWLREIDRETFGEGLERANNK